MGLPGGSVVKYLPASAGAARDIGLIPGSERSPGGGNGNLLQYSCVENPRDRGAWQDWGHKESATNEGLSMHICTPKLTSSGNSSGFIVLLSELNDTYITHIHML